MSLPLLIYGAGGHSKVVFDAARSAGMTVHVLADDDDALEEAYGLRVINPQRDWSLLPSPFSYIVAIGDNPARTRVFEELRKRGCVPLSVLHRSAIVATGATVGDGTLLCAGAVINPGARLGINCILNTCASVDHDCLVGDHVHLCPGVRLGGDVVVGSGTMIGLGAVVLPGVKVGAECIVGAGAVVNRDIPARVVAYGNPARVRKSIKE